MLVHSGRSPPPRRCPRASRSRVANPARLALASARAATGNHVNLDGHKNFVQGVAWDPRSMLLTTLSGDRSLRVFAHATHKSVLNVSHRQMSDGGEGKADAGGEVAGMVERPPSQHRLWADDTVKTFFRRLAWCGPAPNCV